MGCTFRNQTLIGYARHNRQTLNDAETRIWSELGRRGFGVRIRRQHPIGPHIVDFACIALKLAVELDGSQHFENPADAIRDAYLAERGWTVLRFWSWEALSDPDMVIRTISAIVEELLENQTASRQTKVLPPRSAQRPSGSPASGVTTEHSPLARPKGPAAPPQAG